MITLGRRGDLHARGRRLSELRSQEVVHKLFDDIGPRRPIVRRLRTILKIGHRPADGAELCTSSSSTTTR